MSRRLAQRGDAEHRHASLALPAAVVVARGRVLVRRAGVERHERVAAQVERHRLERERREVDPHRVPRLAVQRRELVEQSGAGADVEVLHARAQLRQLDVGPRAPPHQRPPGAPGPARRERCGGREPRAAGEVAFDGQPAGAHARTRRLPARHRAVHERSPTRAPRGKYELVVLAEIERVRLMTARGRLGGHGDPALDREGQREAGVVVGVLSDQVDAAGRAGGDALVIAEPRAHHRHRLRALVDQQVAPAELRRHGAERAGAGERVKAQVAGPRGGLDEAADQRLRLLRRVAGLLAPGGGDDRVPHHRGRALAALALLGGDQPGSHVGLAVDGVGVEQVALAVAHVDEDRVVLLRPAAARLGAVVVGPDQLVEEALAAEQLVEQQLRVVRLAVVEVQVQRALGVQSTRRSSCRRGSRKAR